MPTSFKTSNNKKKLQEKYTLKAPPKSTVATTSQSKQVINFACIEAK